MWWWLMRQGLEALSCLRLFSRGRWDPSEGFKMREVTLWVLG